MLTDQEIIAMQMLSQKTDLISVGMENQAELIGNALDFADYFLALSRPDYCDKLKDEKDK